MHCYIYASLRKADSYLWLAERDAFADLPAELTALLGPLRFAMELDLDAQRKLPHEDAAQVLDHLRSRGWHLQLPPAQSLTGANHLDYGRAPHDRQAS
ncbi:MAG TPA: YcgL domain-containing protein [Dyella sp.]|nr:YcgL domain-containing protein [Dyella sp.]